MTEKNNKVPIAILSCFLIAFILQGVLKISGILVFEKALDWKIFAIIDSHQWLEIIYNSILNFISLYCLSFALTSKPYSKKYYHYILLYATAFVMIVLRTFLDLSMKFHVIIDVVAFIFIPFIINITTNKKERLFNRDLFGVVMTLTLNIVLYLYYLGLGYWNGVLNSLLPINPMWLLSSANFLIKFETYIGLFTLMLSANILIKYFNKKENNMYLPLDIATDEAKVKELQEKKAKKNSKKNEK